MLDLTGYPFVHKSPLFSVSEVKGMESVIWLLMRGLRSSRLDRQGEQTFDFLLTFIKVTGIVSLYIFSQLSQTWSLALWQPASRRNKSEPRRRMYS